MKTYKVLSDYSRDHLESSVNDAISQGYEPVGGIAITNVYFNADYEVVDSGKGKPGILFLQAMIRMK